MASWLKGPIQIRQFLIRTAKSPKMLYNPLHAYILILTFFKIIHNRSLPLFCVVFIFTDSKHATSLRQKRFACRTNFAKKHLHHSYTHVSVRRRTWHPNRRDDCSRIEYYRFVVWQEARTPQTLKHVLIVMLLKHRLSKEYRNRMQGHFP